VGKLGKALEKVFTQASPSKAKWQGLATYLDYDWQMTYRHTSGCSLCSLALVVTAVYVPLSPLQ
jgi:hypothetical protein